jgi:hypothetical protein
LRTPDRMAAVMVKKGVFSQLEKMQVSRFARNNGIDLAYLPGRSSDNIINNFITSEDKPGFLQAFPKNISPTTDDQPYFFNFTKWRTPFAAAKTIKEPSHISQGNPTLVMGQLIVSIILSLGLILFPLVVTRREISGRYIKRFLVYFMGLGAGFILLEISLMQKLTLFLGHPVFSIMVTLFSLLVFTGLGSLLSERLFQAPSRKAWLVPAGLAVWVSLFLISSSVVVMELIIWPLAGRIAFTLMLLAPIGLLLGMPFAYGIRLLNRFNPDIVPWAWAVNACCTVVGSVLSVILSMNLGFSFVMISALLVYFASFVAIRRLPA